LIEEAESLVERSGGDRLRAYLYRAQAGRAAHAGDADESEALLRRSERAFRRSGAAPPRDD
jgi:hypothetical protein